MRFFQQPNNSSITSTVNTASVLLGGNGSSSGNNGKKSNNLSTSPSSTTSTTTASNAAAAAAAAAAANLGSLKKRAAPLPPATRNVAVPNAHSRNASDYGVSLPAQRVKPPGGGGEPASSQSRKSLAGDSYVSNDNKMRSFHQSAAHLRKNHISS